MTKAFETKKLALAPKASQLEEAIGVDVERELGRALAKLREAQEILSGLMEVQDDSVEGLLRARADALDVRLTRAESEAVTGYAKGQTPEEIAQRKGLSARTVGNQLRAGCQKLGFRDRRELKGWAMAAGGWRAARGRGSD